MIAPTLIGLLILNIIPVIQTFMLSFQKVGAFGDGQWVGISNYTKMLKDPAVLGATLILLNMLL